MIDLIEVRNWCIAFVLCIAILAVAAGIVWVCFAHPLPVLSVVLVLFIVIYAKGGTL